MKEDKSMQEKETNATFGPFNSATEHNHKIMGVPNKKADLKSMPKPIRFFYYFIVGVVITGFGFILYATIFK